MKKKTMLMLSAGLLALSLAACGNSNAKEKDAKNDNSISIMASYFTSEPPAKDSQVLQELEKKTDTKLDITWVPSTSYEDKVNVTLNSGDLPEILIFDSKSPSFIKSAKAGAFWDLSDYLKDYPNLAKADENILKNSSLNGKIYGVFRHRDVMRASVTLRKDWLEKLNLEEPQSVEDLYNVAKAFTEQDPDGNGKDDTYGLLMNKNFSLNSGSMYDILATWMGAPNGWGEDQDGNLYPAFMDDKYLESLKWIKKIADEGYINKDFATTSDTQQDLFEAGKGGIVVKSSYLTSSLAQTFGAEKALQMVTFTGTLTDENGDKHAYANDGYEGMLVIPKSSVKTEDELKKILTFIDKTCDEDTQILMNNGLENVNFKRDGRFATAIDPDSNANKKIVTDTQSIAMLGAYVQGNLQLKNLADSALKPVHEKEFAVKEDDMKSAVYNLAAPFVSDTYSTKGATLDKIIDDARIKFMVGQIDEKGWQDAIDQWLTAGGQDVIDELSKLNKADK